MVLQRTYRPKVGLVAVAAACALALAACSGGDSSKSGSKDDLQVTFVTPESTGEYYGAMYCGAKAAAAEQKVDLKIQGTPEVTIEAEMQVLQSVLATDPDGLILTVWDSKAFNSVVNEYIDKGRPVVMPDGPTSTEKYLQSIRTDSYQSSYDAALEVVKSKNLTSGKVLINTDSPGNVIQSARAEGFRDAIEKETDLKVLKFQYVGGDAAKAASSVTSAAAANNDLALVFSTNIGAGTGSANGIATSKRDIVHVGYDTSAAQVEQLRGGEYDALIAQSPYYQGYESMKLISQVLKGEVKEADVKEKTKWAPWKLINVDNVDDADAADFLYTSDCS